MKSFIRSDNSSHDLAGSEGTERLAKLVNDSFDVLNGRWYAERISDELDKNDKKGRTIKERKFHILRELLKVLDKTEMEYESREQNSDGPSEMFCAITTLKALRLTVHSTMALTEEMLENDFNYVLTGKFNQDPVEVLS